MGSGAFLKVLKVRAIEDPAVAAVADGIPAKSHKDTSWDPMPFFVFLTFFLHFFFLT